MKLFHYYSLFGFSNVYLLGNDETGEALIVDPAEITAALIGNIENNGYRLSSVLISHAHSHHVKGLATLLKIYDPTIFAANAWVGRFPAKPLRDGDRADIAGFQFEVHCVPGHSPDSLVYRTDRLVFSGDTIHAGLIGRTLSSYNAVTLAAGLKAKILCLPEDCIILPGHGPPSTVGIEKRFNLGLEAAVTKHISDRYDFFV